MARNHVDCKFQYIRVYGLLTVVFVTGPLAIATERTIRQRNARYRKADRVAGRKRREY